MIQTTHLAKTNPQFFFPPILISPQNTFCAFLFWAQSRLRLTLGNFFTSRRGT